MKAVVREKEDRLVAHDVLRLEVKKLKDLLSVSKYRRMRGTEGCVDVCHA